MVDALTRQALRLALRWLADTAGRVAPRLERIAEGLSGETDHSRRGVSRQVGLIRLELEYLVQALECAQLNLDDLADFISQLPEPHEFVIARELVEAIGGWLDDAHYVVETTLQKDGVLFETQCPSHYPSIDSNEVKAQCQQTAKEFVALAAHLQSRSGALNDLIGLNKKNNWRAGGNSSNGTDTRKSR